MPDVIPEELAWLEAALAAAQGVAAAAATAELLASLGDGRPLTPASLAAWSAEVRQTATADRAAARDRLQAAAERLAARLAAGERPAFWSLVDVFARAVAGEVL